MDHPATAPQPLPRWLRPFSRINALLLRIGLPIGTQHVLTVVGRRTGARRSTPVSVVTLGTERYLVSGEGIAWVGNARAAGRVDLARGRRSETLRVTELETEARGPVLRAFWHQVPHGRPFIARILGLAPNADADAFEAAAPRCPVFRLDPA